MAIPIRVLFMMGNMELGGSQRQLLGLLQGLNRERVMPLLYLVYRQGELVDQIPPDVRVYSFWDQHDHPRWNFPGRIHRTQVRHVQSIITEAQIDVLYERNFLMTLIGAPAARRTATPRVAAIVSNPQQDLPATAGRYQVIKRQRLRRAYREAAAVVAVSQGVKHAATSFYGLPADQIEVLPNTVDLESIARQSQQGDTGFEPDRFHVVAAGRLDPEKGHRFLVQAVQQIVSAEPASPLLVHLVGTGSQQDSLQQYVATHKLADHVRFHGYVQNPSPLLSQAQLVCLPSLYEGLPNVLLEAMAGGTPVLSTDCPEGPREILSDGKFGRLVPPADPAALAEAILDAMQNYGSWQSCVAGARRHVEQEYAQAIGIQRLEQLLARVCGR